MNKIWEYAAFPLDPKDLIKAVETHEYPSYLFSVLGTINAPAVREFALDMLRTRPLSLFAVEPLIASFRMGDEELILAAMAASIDSDEDHRHRIGSDVLALLRKWPSIDPRPFCEWIYEHGPCSLCRGTAVSNMLDVGGLPEQIKIEAAYDSDPDTVKLVSSIQS